MRIKLILITYLVFNINNISLSNENNCQNLKKFSVEYVKCKANLAKNKTISAGKNFIDETKDYQNKQWSKEKKKFIKTKEKINDVKEKILN